MLKSKISINGHIISVWNTHFPLKIEYIKSYIQYLSKYVKETTDKRLILCGDFNTEDMNMYNKKELRWIIENMEHESDKSRLKYISELYKVFGMKVIDDSKYTVWSGRKVDYIFYRGMRYRSGGSFYIRCSDHLPYFNDLLFT